MRLTWRGAWLAVALGVALSSPAHAASAASVAARTWTGVRTEHLEVLTDAGRGVAERVAERLEDLRAALAVATPALVIEGAPVQVIVFRDEALARAYAPTWRGLKDDVAGFFHAGPDRRRLLFVDDHGRTPSVAQHEYIHALLDAALPEAPLWLNEGLAEYFSTFHADGGHARAGGPVLHHVEWLESHDVIGLPELFAVTQGESAYHEGDRRGTFYAQSWLLTHLLLSGREGEPARLERVLVATRDGERFADAFRREFGDEAALRLRLHAYLDRQRFAERDWAPARNVASRPLPRVRDRVPVNEVLASLGIGFLARPTPQREEAETHLRAALERDEQDADACAGMGWLQLQRGRRAEARIWFERALAREPVSVTAVKLFASQTLLDVSRRKAEDERKAVALDARRSLERARLVAAGDPELLALLARTWVVWHEPDAEPGWALAERAVALLPGRADVQLDRIALAALTGRDEQAAALVERHFPPGSAPEPRRAARTALLAGDVRAANLLVTAGDPERAEGRLRAARRRVADDPELASEADRFLEQFAQARAKQADAQRENRAITDYNAGVQAANARRHADAAAAFRRAAEATGHDDFRSRSRLLAKRMDMRVVGDRAMELARNGDRAGARALLDSIDRNVLDAEDRRWLDDNRAKLRLPRAREVR